MPPKKKEVGKKEDEQIDEAALPPWTSYQVYLHLHPHLQSCLDPFLASLSYIYRTVSRTELSEFAVEKELMHAGETASPAVLAKAYRLKISQLELAARVAKRDKVPRGLEDKKKPPAKEAKGKDAKGKIPISPRNDADEADPDLQEVIYIMHDYPETVEEAQAIYAEGGCFNMLLHCRPTDAELKDRLEKQREAYEKLVLERKEKVDRGEDPGQEPTPPIPPDAYPAIFLELQRLSIAAPSESAAHQCCSKVVTHSAKEAAELSEEERDLRFTKAILEAIKEPAKAYLKFEAWLKTIQLISIPYTADKEATLYERLIWDIRENQASEAYFLLCLLFQTVRRADHSHESEAKTLDQHFSSLWNEISHSMNAQEPVPVLPPSPLPPQTIIHDFDRIKANSGNLPLSKLSIAELLQQIYDGLHLPGLRRFMMPAVAIKPESERGEERTALESFASIPVTAFHRALILTHFESALKKTQPEREWDFGDRIFEERLDNSLSGQILLETALLDPETVIKYDELTDSLLVAVLHKAPQGRVYRQRWHYPWRAKPCFEHWHACMRPQDITQPSFLDVDSSITGEIREKTKIFCPADDSIVKTSDLFIGPRRTGEKWWKEVSTSSSRVVVIKDDILFGIKAVAGKPEFWTKFRDNARVIVERTASGLAVSLGSESGLVAKILPDGSVVQQCDYRPVANYEVPKLSEEVEEVNRVVTLKGTVIRYMKNSTIQIYFANGNVSVRSTDKVWQTVNNKGRRRAKRQKDGIEYLLDSIKVSTFIDPETSAKVLIREDWTIVVKYSDGALVALHKDGTKMYTSPNKTKIVVEHPKYAAVLVTMDPAKARQHTIIGSRSTDSGLGAGDVMMRSHDGLILEVRMDSGLTLHSFVQKQEMEGLNQFAVNRVNLVEARDGTVIKTQQDGEVAVISGGARRKLAERGEGDQFAYFYELFSVPEDRSFGVYTADLKAEVLWTKDAEGNLFTMKAAGGAQAKLAVSLNFDDIAGQEPHSPAFSDGEYIDPESRFLPPPPSIPDPRLFVVSANSTCTELLSEKQLASYFLLQQKLGGSVTSQEVESATAVTVTWRPDVHPDPRFIDSPLEKYGLPSSVGEVKQTEPLPAIAIPEIYNTRTFFKFVPFTSDDRVKFLDDLQRFKEWREAKAVQRKEWITTDPRSEADRKEEQAALAKIQIMLFGAEPQRSDHSDEFVKSLSRGSAQDDPSISPPDPEDSTPLD